jgi:hypothetical protein
MSEIEKIDFKGISYIQHPITDQETFDQLPSELQPFFEKINGLVAYNGGFQIRGCVTGTNWDALKHYWTGDAALYKTYKNLTAQDVPFAQDFLGDQYVYRDGTVWHLQCETGDLDDLELDFNEFLAEVTADPIEFLALYPLIEFMESGKNLKVGQLLQANQPFSVETDKPFTFKATTTEKQLQWLKAYYLKNN